MPSGPRIRANNVYGIISDNPLTIGATTMTSIGLSVLPVVASAHAIIVLDPKRLFGEPEIVIVTAHVAGATTATITRAAYGSAARSHPMNTSWAHIAIDEDFIKIATSSTRPSNPYVGQVIYETDSGGFKFYNGASWATFGGGGGTSIPQQISAPAAVTDALWLDTDEGAGVGLSSIIAYAETTSDSGTITTETDMPGMSVNVTVPAGRRIRISVKTEVRGTANDVYVYNIKEGATVLQRFTGRLPSASSETVSGGVVVSPTAGSHTYKLTLALGSGTGVINGAAPTYPAYIMVEDITGTLWPAGQSIGAGQFASEAWTSYTPAFSNITIGNGILTGKYIKYGRTVHVRGQFVLGSTSAITGFLYMNLPSGLIAAGPAVGLVYAQDAGLNHYGACWYLVASATDGPLTPMNTGHWNATTPFTWGTADWFQWSLTFETTT